MEEINIGLRQEQLRNLQEYVKDIDKDITLILQSLQWDRKHLQQNEKKVTCKYDSNHRIPVDNVKEHEKECYLKSQNYIPGELFFPEPLDANAVTVVKLSTENINDIINYAVKTDPSFKRNDIQPSSIIKILTREGSELGVSGHAPLTLDRLQAAHSSDERRALYDAVVAAAPAPATLARDPAIDGPTVTSTCEGSRDDALLALRDARRRRARHRGAARYTYQDELRGLISAQMELFTGKCNDELETKPYVTIDESEDARRCGRESDRLDRVRNDVRSKYLNPSRKEHGESREDRKQYKRENREDKRREYQRESRDDIKRKYERESREDKRRTREDEYDKKYKERNNIYEHDDRKRLRQYDKEYSEIKQEKDDYPAERRKREERRYDYKDRKQETNRSISRDNKKYHKREERHHKQKSAERRRGRSRDREYDRNYKSDINCSHLKIKTEPPDYK